MCKPNKSFLPLSCCWTEYFVIRIELEQRPNILVFLRHVKCSVVSASLLQYPFLASLRTTPFGMINKRLAYKHPWNPNDGDHFKASFMTSMKKGRSEQEHIPGKARIKSSAGFSTGILAQGPH